MMMFLNWKQFSHPPYREKRISAKRKNEDNTKKEVKLRQTYTETEAEVGGREILTGTS